MNAAPSAVLPSGHGLMVRKSNELVRLATYEMSTREVKLLVVAISRLQQRSQDDFGPVVVGVRELSGLLGLQSEAVYSDIKAMAETLTSRVVRLHDPETKTHKWTNWCDVVYVEGSGCVQIIFREALKPHLLHLAEFFVRYGLENVLRLASTYHIRLYEFLKSWESFGKPRVVEMVELRRILGAEAKAYDRYFTLNGSVLKPAAAAINKLTDVRFGYQPVRQGRKVSAVRFTIKSPPQPELPFGEPAGALLPAGPTPPAVDGAAAPGVVAPLPDPGDDLFSRLTPAPSQVVPETDPTTLAALGKDVVAHWNERMVHSPVADTGPGRLEEIGRRVVGDDYLRANWREAIDVVSESKVWNGRGHRGRDGEPFHASFRWFQEHVADVADAAAARRQRLQRRKTLKPGSPLVPAEVPPGASPPVVEPAPQVKPPAETIKGLREFRGKLKQIPEVAPIRGKPWGSTPVPPSA